MEQRSKQHSGEAIAFSSACAQPFNAIVPDASSEVSAASTVHRLLIVDDNTAIHDDFRKILGPGSVTTGDLDALERELLGEPQNAPVARHTQAFELYSAYQGEAAVELVEQARREGRPYTLAFVDVRMPPGMDGIETVSRMWQADPHLQVVVCSAYSDHSFSDIVGALGQNDGLLVLRKPFEAIEVLQAAHALSHKWTVSNQLRDRLIDLEELVQQRTKALEAAIDDLRLEVEQRRRAEAEARHIATHDALTGIPNRHLLRESLGRALSRARRRKTLVAVLLLDLDNFKEVNDTYGHAAGDELLKEMARRLRACVRESDMVARMGGDEFVLLLEDLTEPEEASIVATRVLEQCNQPFDVAGEDVHTPPSIGIAMFPHDCDDGDTLLKIADVAMYEAKTEGRGGYRYYAEGMLASSEEKLRMREELLRALANEEFALVYQPLVDTDTGAICAFEALLRWEHPQRGTVAPLKFIPIAEKSGLIIQLGAWVLRTACAQLAQWRGTGQPGLRMAVNVSAREVQAPGFMDLVMGTLNEFGLEPSELELELTESMATLDVEKSAQVLVELTNWGVRLAIDDFGSGYSSLMRLKQMPISVLKIDRYFIKDITHNTSDAAIVRAVMGMAQSMGLTVVAEGVETYEQLAVLRNIQAPLTAMRCDRIQGYLVSRPLTPSDAGALLAQPPHSAFGLTGS